MRLVLEAEFGGDPLLPPWTQDVDWTYIRRSKDVLDVSWTSYVRSIYALCPAGCYDNKKSNQGAKNQNNVFTGVWGQMKNLEAATGDVL